MNPYCPLPTINCKLFLPFHQSRNEPSFGISGRARPRVHWPSLSGWYGKNGATRMPDLTPNIVARNRKSPFIAMENANQITRSITEWALDGSSIAFSRNRIIWWAKSTLTGQISLHAPQREHAKGSLPAFCNPTSCGVKIEPIGPGYTQP